MQAVVVCMPCVVAVSTFQLPMKTTFRRPPVLKARQIPASLAEVEGFLAEEYPSFNNLLSMNDDVWKALREAGGGFTLFAPNEEAFQKLGQKKLDQILDGRNTETTEKIGAYHVVNEPVTPEELFAAGGIITMGGEVPVGRSRSGGFFGLGEKEDGGSLVGGANVVKSFGIDDCIVYETDALISPNILWRYMDQLRIPGSQ